MPAARAHKSDEEVEPHPQARDEGEHQGADGLQSRPGGRDPVHDDGAAVAAHPDALPFDATVEIAAPPVLLQEGVERGEQVRHGARE